MYVKIKSWRAVLPRIVVDTNSGLLSVNTETVNACDFGSASVFCIRSRHLGIIIC